MLTLDKIYHAKYVLKDVIRRTDLIQAPNINPDAMGYKATRGILRGPVIVGRQ